MLSCANVRHELRKHCGALPIFSRVDKSFSTLAMVMLLGMAGLFVSSLSTVDVRGYSTYNVALVNYLFQPQTINITTGTNVVWTFWTNGSDSGDVHTVTADNQTQSGGGVFQSSLMHAGQTFTFTFYSPGKYPYHCSVHPTMTGLVIATGPALTPPSGANNSLLYLVLGVVAAVAIGGASMYLRKSRRKGKIRQHS